MEKKYEAPVAERYYYSAEEPTTVGNYRRWVNNAPAIWSATDD